MNKLSIRKSIRKDNNSKKTLSFAQGVTLIAVASLLMLGSSLYYWYQNVLTNPERILSGMLDKSLQTTSVNRTITQAQGDNKVEQVMQTEFSPRVITKSVTVMNERSELGKTAVTTETIGTKTDDYVRYTNINIENPQNKRDFGSVTNVWASRASDAETGVEASFLNTILFAAVPFGDLNTDQRRQLKDEINKVNLYNYTDTKLEYISGRPVMNFAVDLDPQALVTVLAKYSELTGLGNKEEYNPALYEGESALKVNLQVDVLTRHIKKIDFLSTARVESYQSYNAKTNISTPENTIDVNELQTKLSAIESGNQ